ncbi:MAG TPA: hypothetical protein VK923_13905 [Euzebyales bacterium]|nr:hypothetical protein [Euzebyales bacterium]
MAPWVFPFDRTRHERARRLLGPDSADVFTRPVATADIIDFHAREYEGACIESGQYVWCADTASTQAVLALNRLADVEERHLVLVGGEPGHDTLTLAGLAVTHRRQLAQRMPATQRPLLALSLVLLTHQLHAAGRFADAVATGQEAVDILSRMLGDVHDIDARPALVLALDVSLMTRLVNGRRFDAMEDLVRATDVLEALVRDRPEHDDDLAHHLEVLALTTGSPDLDDDTRTLLDRTSRWDLTLREPRRMAPPALLSSSRTEADELYDDSVHLATSDGDGPAAAAAAGAAVSAYRRILAGQPAERWHATLRQLARALWRRAVVLSELLDRPRDALGPGREALSLTRRVLRVVERAEEFDELVGELGVTIHDLSTIAMAAGLVGEHDQLAEEVARLDTTSVGRDAMRTLGAALHNRAAEACETTVALAEHGRGMRATVLAGIRNSAQAVAVRRETADDDPMAQWELANSQLAHGHLRCLNGEGQQGAQSMADAYHTVLTLAGPAGQTMREAAEAALLAACAAYPDVTPRDDWPL